MSKLSDYVGAIVGGVDLSSPTISTVTIVNSSGDNAIILGATELLAGVMTAEQVEKLNGIADNANNYIHPNFSSRSQNINTGNLSGASVISQLNVQLTSNTQGHVTSASTSVGTRILTLANLGYTGDTNANEYIHPSFTSRNVSEDTGNLTGATVVSRVQNSLTVNNEGHVSNAQTSLATRQLTAADIGAVPENEVPTIASGAYTPAFTGGTTNGVASGTVVWVTVGNLVIVTGRITWTTPPTGSGQMRITGLPYTADFGVGFGFSGNNVENQANAANGMHITLAAGSNQLYIWGYNENGVSTGTSGNDFNSNGYINISFSYYSSQVPAARGLSL
jgi:hypothetical protein